MAARKIITLFREGIDSVAVEYDANNFSNVAALRAELGMAGKTCAVNNVVVSDENLPISNGDNVAFTGGHKSGGSI
jgi:molybdopterin converting factor small subunit